jgi:Melibiase
MGFVWGPARCTASSAMESRSGDAYVHFYEPTTTWTLGTSRIEETLGFVAGNFRLVKLKNVVSGRELVSTAQQSEEFRVGVDNLVYTGTSSQWVLKGSNVNVLPQGEVQLVIRLANEVLLIEKHYVVYPHTSIIRQWIGIENVSSRPITVSDPYFFSGRIQLEQDKPLSLYYMTGGGYFTGSQILKHVFFDNAFARIFDSTDKPERIELGGSNYGDAMPWGSGAYMQWFCVMDAASEQGVYFGFDYYGRWAADLGNFFGTAGYVGLRVAGYHKVLPPGESVITPKAFVGVFTGDLDSMGNELKDWQYRYLWDYTNNDYVGKIRYSAEMQWQVEKSSVDWGGGTQDNWDFRMATLFHTVDLMRYVGADILWQDAGWHDYLGDNDGPDFAQATKYMSKYGMGLAVWWPLYTVSEHSKIYHQHSDWLSESETFSGSNLDTSKKQVIDYLLGQLNDKVSAWGDFQWRLDGTAVVPINKDENPMLTEYQNVMGLLADFRRLHPHSSIDICSGGGNLMGFETLHLSDVSQLTDGGSLYIGNYYSSYLFPPDKIDDWTRVANFTWENARSTLAMAPAWSGDRGLYGGEPGLLLNSGLENLRRTFEIYRYLVSQSVAGRWSHVFHPRVTGDDSVYYFERLNQDGDKGIIILKHFITGPITIYPKGLRSQNTYDIRFEVSKKVARRTGADLMRNGISLIDPAGGELIYLGLPNHPGSGSDHIAPSDPHKVTKKLATNIGVHGVELKWIPSTDNNWLSYYQIFRDGMSIDKVAKGTYYFDHSQNADIAALYEVLAVDGDGNASKRIKAEQLPGDPETFTAEGGFLAGPDYSYQGANGWSYEEWVGSSHTKMRWNGALGHMGAYQGSGADRSGQAIMGASWMLPGRTSDVVRVFTLPHSGLVTVTASIHKDIYHTYGDGVQARVLKNAEQVWPHAGWQTIAAAEVAGKTMALKLSVKKGDNLFFVLNRNADATDDQTVWNPQIVYDHIDDDLTPTQVAVIDNSSSRLKYSDGWQRLGLNPWNSDVDQGYKSGWIQGTVSISSTAGATMSMKFHGTGVELLGDVGGDGGIAAITLDGTQIATIDTFAPSHVPSSIWALPSKRIGHWSAVPPVRLWGIQNLQGGEHAFEIRVTGEKNVDSIGTAIGIDAVIISNGSVDIPDAAQK